MSTDLDWTFVPFKFGSKKSEEKLDDTPKKRKQKLTKLHSGVEINVTEHEKNHLTYYTSHCPVHGCAHETVKSLNKLGAEKTLNQHLRIWHKVSR